MVVFAGWDSQRLATRSNRLVCCRSRKVCWRTAEQLWRWPQALHHRCILCLRCNHAWPISWRICRTKTLPYMWLSNGMARC